MKRKRFFGNFLKVAGIFLLSLVLIFGIFIAGYNYGQKGKKILGFGADNVTNTEVGKPKNIDFSLFWEAWNKLKNDSALKPDSQEMIYGSISGMLSSVDDPYTVFFTPDENKQFAEDIGGQFSGIGVELVEKNNLPTVVAPLSDTPAEKAGIRSGDIILEVDGTKTSEIGFNDLVNKIRGQSGTKVTLKVSREGNDQPLTFQVTRETITVKSVEWSLKNISSKKIYYVKIRQFGDDTDQLFNQFVDEAITGKPDGVIIDLRNNPGGYFETAVNLSSYFLDGGTVVKQQDKDGKTKSFSTTKKARLLNIKTAIIVNKGSASASEIMSGALQDRKAAKLIGDTTFGKGSVQELINLSDGSALKITIAKWLTPNDRMINGTGIAPDIVVTNPNNANNDAQYERAIDYLVSGK